MRYRLAPLGPRRPAQTGIRPRLAGLLLILAAAAPSQGFISAHAAILEVGPGRPYPAPSDAARFARDGDRVRIAPGSYGDCAVWRANRLVIEGSGPGVVIRDVICMDKGIFVIVGDDVTVRGLSLTGARSVYGNGAGIRQEGRNLTVERVRFLDNQNGILGAPSPGSTVVIRDSDFERNGVCAPVCAHGIYFNALKRLRVERSRFYATRQGHHIKSRAARTEIVGCDIADGPEGTSSYLIDLPNGGSGLIRRNRLEKGPKSDNQNAAIAIGEEGLVYQPAKVLVEQNTFVNVGAYSTAFVWSPLPTPPVLRNNRIRGRVVAPLNSSRGAP
jgi:hypothetical protein